MGSSRVDLFDAIGGLRSRDGIGKQVAAHFAPQGETMCGLEWIQACRLADPPAVNGGHDQPQSDCRQRAFGDFVIERELGRGGMGVVWLATQKSLGRRVALKTLPDFATMDPAAVLRFRREAEATSRIAHPGVVPVYGTGDSDGIHWYAMEYVDGPTLASWIETLASRQCERLDAALVDEVLQGARFPSLREPRAGGPGSRYVRSCARICADVASALAAAHSAGVIHRDVKPGNVMIHPSGRPVVVDFGLARDERNAQLTRSGEQIGTPSYMAPEQARGSRAIDARADVYALGAVLYELLTLQPPFTGASSAEIAARILAEEAVDVRRRNPTVPVTLAAIVHRCLMKDPDRRYPAMESLEADLRAFLAGHRVAAKLPSFLARVQAAMQRRRNVLVGSGVAAVAATSIAVFVGVVDDRGDVRDGEVALAAARVALVEHGDADRARDLYERAAALTKRTGEVASARRRDFAAAFESLYGAEGGVETLRRFAAVFAEWELPELKPQLERLEGRGALRPSTRVTEQRVTALAERRVTENKLEQDWSPIRAGAPLAVGERLVRATRDDGVVALFAAMVRSDETLRVEPRFVEGTEGAGDFVVAVDSETGRADFVAKSEISRAQWRRWLASLPERAQREMTPAAPIDGDGSLAARGLSFHQARAFAVAHGAHLPLRRELWLAASAGLRGIVWPWGGGFDAQRVVADPFTRSDAMAVDSMREGESPLGVLHALGNVAEALSAEGSRLFAGGGSYADEAAQLALDGARASTFVAPLASAFEPSLTMGTRIWRCLPQPDDAVAAASMRMRREENERAPRGCVFHDWTLAADGALTCELLLVGVYDGDDRERMIRFDTPGFAQHDGTLRASDGHGRALVAESASASGSERAFVRTELPTSLRRGQGYRFRVGATLDATTGLLPTRDAFVLRLPMARGLAVAQTHTLTLPAGCRVESVTPEADVWFEAGSARIAWRQTAEARVESACVRFRRDGGLAAELALCSEAQARCCELIASWNEGAPSLAALLDPDFVHAQSSTDRFDFVELVDVARVGAVESCEALVDWTASRADGGTFLWRRAPFLVQWRVAGDAMRALRMQPFPQADDGRYDSVGYRNDALRALVRKVDGATLARTQDELCPLQVELTAGAFLARVTGLLAAPGDSEDVVCFRLAGVAGLSLAADGTALREFAQASSSACERVTFVQRGSRRFCVRVRAVGDDAVAARAMLASEASRRFSAAAIAALVVE